MIRRIESLPERITRLNRLSIRRDRDNVQRLAEYYQRLDHWTRHRRVPPIRVVRA